LLRTHAHVWRLPRTHARNALRTCVRFTRLRAFTHWFTFTARTFAFTVGLFGCCTPGLCTLGSLPGSHIGLHIYLHCICTHCLTVVYLLHYYTYTVLHTFATTLHAQLLVVLPLHGHYGWLPRFTVCWTGLWDTGYAHCTHTLPHTRLHTHTRWFGLHLVTCLLVAVCIPLRLDGPHARCWLRTVRGQLVGFAVGYYGCYRYVTHGWLPPVCCHSYRTLVTYTGLHYTRAVTQLPVTCGCTRYRSHSSVGLHGYAVYRLPRNILLPRYHTGYVTRSCHRTRFLLLQFTRAYATLCTFFTVAFCGYVLLRLRTVVAYRPPAVWLPRPRYAHHTVTTRTLFLRLVAVRCCVVLYVTTRGSFARSTTVTLALRCLHVGYGLLLRTGRISLLLRYTHCTHGYTRFTHTLPHTAPPHGCTHGYGVWFITLCHACITTRYLLHTHALPHGLRPRFFYRLVAFTRVHRAPLPRALQFCCSLRHAWYRTCSRFTVYRARGTRLRWVPFTASYTRFTLLPRTGYHTCLYGCVCTVTRAWVTVTRGCTRGYAFVLPVYGYVPFTFGSLHVTRHTTPVYGWLRVTRYALVPHARGLPVTHAHRFTTRARCCGSVTLRSHGSLYFGLRAGSGFTYGWLHAHAVAGYTHAVTRFALHPRTPHVAGSGSLLRAFTFVGYTRLFYVATGVGLPLRLGFATPHGSVHRTFTGCWLRYTAVYWLRFVPHLLVTIRLVPAFTLRLHRVAVTVCTRLRTRTYVTFTFTFAALRFALVGLHGFAAYRFYAFTRLRSYTHVYTHVCCPRLRLRCTHHTGFVGCRLLCPAHLGCRLPRFCGCLPLATRTRYDAPRTVVYALPHPHTVTLRFTGYCRFWFTRYARCGGLLRLRLRCYARTRLLHARLRYRTLRTLHTRLRFAQPFPAPVTTHFAHTHARTLHWLVTRLPPTAHTRTVTTRVAYTLGSRCLRLRCPCTAFSYVTSSVTLPFYHTFGLPRCVYGLFAFTLPPLRVARLRYRFTLLFTFTRTFTAHRYRLVRLRTYRLVTCRLRVYARLRALVGPHRVYVLPHGSAAVAQLGYAHTLRLRFFWYAVPLIRCWFPVTHLAILQLVVTVVRLRAFTVYRCHTVWYPRLHTVLRTFTFTAVTRVPYMPRLRTRLYLPCVHRTHTAYACHVVATLLQLHTAPHCTLRVGYTTHGSHALPFGPLRLVTRSYRTPHVHGYRLVLPFYHTPLPHICGYATHALHGSVGYGLPFTAILPVTPFTVTFTVYVALCTLLPFTVGFRTFALGWFFLRYTGSAHLRTFTTRLRARFTLRLHTVATLRYALHALPRYITVTRLVVGLRCRTFGSPRFLLRAPLHTRTHTVTHTVHHALDLPHAVLLHTPFTRLRVGCLLPHLHTTRTFFYRFHTAGLPHTPRLYHTTHVYIWLPVTFATVALLPLVATRFYVLRYAVVTVQRCRAVYGPGHCGCCMQLPLPPAPVTFHTFYRAHYAFGYAFAPRYTHMHTVYLCHTHGLRLHVRLRCTVGRLVTARYAFVLHVAVTVCYVVTHGTFCTVGYVYVATLVRFTRYVCCTVARHITPGCSTLDPAVATVTTRLPHWLRLPCRLAVYTCCHTHSRGCCHALPHTHFATRVTHRTPFYRGWFTARLRAHVVLVYLRTALVLHTHAPRTHARAHAYTRLRIYGSLRHARLRCYGYWITRTRYSRCYSTGYTFVCVTHLRLRLGHTFVRRCTRVHGRYGSTFATVAPLHALRTHTFHYTHAGCCGLFAVACYAVACVTAGYAVAFTYGYTRCRVTRTRLPVAVPGYTGWFGYTHTVAFVTGGYTPRFTLHIVARLVLHDYAHTRTPHTHAHTVAHFTRLRAALHTHWVTRYTHTRLLDATFRIVYVLTHGYGSAFWVYGWLRYYTRWLLRLRTRLRWLLRYATFLYPTRYISVHLWLYTRPHYVYTFTWLLQRLHCRCYTTVTGPHALVAFVLPRTRTWIHVTFWLPAHVCWFIHTRFTFTLPHTHSCWLVTLYLVTHVYSCLHTLDLPRSHAFLHCRLVTSRLDVTCRLPLPGCWVPCWLFWLRGCTGLVLHTRTFTTHTHTPFYTVTTLYGLPHVYRLLPVPLRLHHVTYTPLHGYLLLPLLHCHRVTGWIGPLHIFCPGLPIPTHAHFTHTHTTPARLPTPCLRPCTVPFDYRLHTTVTLGPDWIRYTRWFSWLHIGLRLLVVACRLVTHTDTHTQLPHTLPHHTHIPALQLHCHTLVLPTHLVTTRWVRLHS